MWGGHGTADYNAMYAADHGSNPSPLLHVTSPFSPIIFSLISAKQNVSVLSVYHSHQLYVVVLATFHQ